MAGTPVIPQDAQIDAFLAGKLSDLVRRYCNGVWSDLPKGWTVRPHQIFLEAQRRGLNNHVSIRPTSEGFWLLETENGYVVFYLERGVRAYHQEFTSLEPAFLHWLDQELRVRGLPVLE